MLLVIKQHPDLDIRMVFQRHTNKLFKGSRTTYSEWCEKHNIKWADKQVPIEWIKEKKKQQTRRTPAIRAKVFEKLNEAQVLAEEKKYNEALGKDSELILATDSEFFKYLKIIVNSIYTAFKLVKKKKN